MPPGQFQFRGLSKAVQRGSCMVYSTVIEVTMDDPQKDAHQQAHTDSKPVIRRDESFYFVDIIFLVSGHFFRNLSRVRPTSTSTSFRLKNVYSKFQGLTLSATPKSSALYSNFLWHRIFPSRDPATKSLYVWKG
jgi:hypothetical protein